MINEDKSIVSHQMRGDYVKRLDLLGNKFGVGNFGCTAKYQTPEELRDKIMEYLVWTQGDYETRTRTVTRKDGTQFEEEYEHCLRRPTPLSVTGLALYLGFAQRKSIYEQAKRGEEYAEIIAQAITIVENSYELDLRNPACAGAVFALKNMNWHDRIENLNINLGEENMDINFK